MYTEELTNFQLFLLGDYVGYGSCSKQTLIEINGLIKQYGAIALWGNHDYALYDFFKKGKSTLFLIEAAIISLLVVYSYIFEQ